MSAIDLLVQSYVDRQAALGAAVAVLQRGEIVYLGGFGTTSVEEGGVPVTPLTLFAYGSICKTICATLIMRLVEEGLLELDVPVVHYLPDLQFSDAGRGRRVTLRHLLSHTSGLPMAGKYWGPRDPDALRRFVYEQIPHYSFLSEPGSVHHYSNTVICVAGHVAEAVTGKYYDDLVQAYVFDPLQMARTTFDPAVALTYPLALPHEPGPDGEPRVTHRLAYNVSGNPSSFALGSVADLAQLAQMFLNQGNFGGQQYLNGASIAEMRRAYGSRYIGAAAHPLAHIYEGYGLGFQVGQYRDRPVARHGGMSQSNNCFFDLFPEERAGVVLLTNYSQEEPLMELVAALYDYALEVPRRGIVFLDKPTEWPGPTDGREGQRYSGHYLNVEAGDLVNFVVAGDTLVLEQRGESLSLVSIGEGEFYAELSPTLRRPVTFVLDVACVMIAGQPYYPITVDPGFRPEPARWEAYAGIYRDPSNWNLEEMLCVRVEESTLFIAEGEEEVAATPLDDRSFVSEMGLIEFEETGGAGVHVLVWGRATRYYRLDERAYGVDGVVEDVEV